MKETHATRAVKKLLEARALIIGADAVLNEVWDSLEHCLEIVHMIDNELKYFPKTVEEVNKDFYDRFIKNKD